MINSLRNPQRPPYARTSRLTEMPSVAQLAANTAVENPHDPSNDPACIYTSVTPPRARSCRYFISLVVHSI